MGWKGWMGMERIWVGGVCFLVQFFSFGVRILVSDTILHKDLRGC